MPRPSLSVLILALGSAAAAQPCQPEWSPMGLGLNGVVFALAVFDDGAGPALYAAGDFTTAGGHPAQGIARWDGVAWSGVGNGGGPDTAIGLLQPFDDGSGPALYAMGSFTMMDGVPAAGAARWDGEAWSQVGDGLAGFKYTAAVFDDGSGPALFVGGRNLKGQEGWQYVARLDGDVWTLLDGLGGWYSQFCPMDSVRTLQPFNDGSGPALYAGGRFDWVNDIQTYDAARWNGTEWEAIDGLDDECNAITCLSVLGGEGDPTLVAAWGSRESLLGWDGVHWQEIAGSKTETWIPVMLAHDDGSGPALFAGMEADEWTFSGLARWDGVAWSGVGGGVGGKDARVIQLESFHGALYVAGWFESAGGKPAQNIARWGCPPCTADCDHSGVLELADWLCFTALFNAADPAADCDASGSLDLFDFLCFINAFNAGC